MDLEFDKGKGSNVARLFLVRRVEEKITFFHTHTLTQIHTHNLSLSHTHIHTHTLSHTQSHSHTNTHTYSHTHTLTHAGGTVSQYTK